MKKNCFIPLCLFFLLAFVFLHGCAGQRYTKDSFPGWTWIGGHDDGNALYMDKQNVKKNDRNIMAWYTMTIGGDYMTYYLEIDCSSEKYRGLSATRYDKNGNVKETMGEQQHWDYAAIGTAYNVMMKEACR